MAGQTRGYKQLHLPLPHVFRLSRTGSSSASRLKFATISSRPVGRWCRMILDIAEEEVLHWPMVQSQLRAPRPWLRPALRGYRAGP
jgi:hypothetical protein